MRHIAKALNKGGFNNGSNTGFRSDSWGSLKINHHENPNTSIDVTIEPDGTTTYHRKNWAGGFGAPVGDSGRRMSTDSKRYKRELGISCIYRVAA